VMFGSGGGITLGRRSIRVVGFGMQYACEMLLTQAKLGVRVTEGDGEVGVGAEGLGRELRLYLTWLHSTVSSLSGTQANEGQLIVLTALQSECASVGPIRNDGVADFPESERRVQPVGVNGGQVSNDLLEESFEVLHDPSLSGIRPSPHILQCWYLRQRGSCRPLSRFCAE
jgi:hypothetical protein